MKKGSLNHWIGFFLLISIISFFFYKSIYSDIPLTKTLNTIEDIQDLQVRLHRDLLRYRSNQIQGYDTLNNTLATLNEKSRYLSNTNAVNEDILIVPIGNLEKLIWNESQIVEDFKTHHSILHNSLSYIFNISEVIYSQQLKYQSTQKQQVIAELITLLLEYNKKPDTDIAKKIYPLIDTLNVDADADTNALINHSLIIIEHLPEIDNILSWFNSLNVENQIILLKNTVSDLRKEQSNDIKTFNVLLFLCTIYLIFYILYIFLSLRKNKDKLSESNARLNNEIGLRQKTEHALYQLVNIDKESNNHEDRILFLLSALCNALNVEYAYLSTINHNRTNAEIIGVLEHGVFGSNFACDITDTPCEEVLKFGRVVHNNDLQQYFPNTKNGILKHAVSYIGISLFNKKKNIIGLIAIASDFPINDVSLAENILTISTSRAIIELENQIEINNSIRYQKGLTLIDNWIARLITEGYDKDAFFKNICLAAQEITNTQLAAFPALGADMNEYNFLASSGVQSELFKDMICETHDESICSWTILNNRNLVINDVSSDQRIPEQLSRQLGIKSALLTPVTLKDEPYGAIAVFRTYDEFDKIDEQLMTQFSQSVQMAIINMQLVSDIKTERERAEVTLHSIGDAVITTNISGKIEYMNHVAESLTSWSYNEAKNKNVQDVFRIEDMDTGEPIHDVVLSCIDNGIAIEKSVLILINKDGAKKDIESSISPILNTSGTAEGVVIVFHDETERRQLENTIKYQASHDPLTDLLNRAAFDIELSNHVYDAVNNTKDHILCYLDLDRFKLINDTAGHSAGDQCLIQVTSLIQSCIRSEDILGRLGGDEFGLILKNCSREVALKITNNVVKMMADMQFNWDGCDYSLGVSIGITPLDRNTKNAKEAIRKADLACYTAKDQGKSQTYMYEEQDSELIRRQEESYWATRITDAIEKNRLQLFAQPIISLKNNNHLYSHVEILVRLLDENNKLIAPDAFIPAAERYNLIHLIDRSIIYETFLFINKYSASNGNNTLYSINLSGNTLGDKEIVEYINTTADRFEVDPRNICFEITETAAIKELQKAKKFIRELKSRGYKFALDDFGSGLSSFQYLKTLSVDYLKIDGGFVADMVNNNIDHAMVAAINEVAHIMGIETIAEYVENDQIIKKLQDLNVDYGQGYGIEQPRPIKEMLSFSLENSPALKLVNSKS